MSCDKSKNCLPCPPILPINFIVGNTAPQVGVPKIINGVEANRMFRNGIPTTCDSKKICPGPFVDGPIAYTALGFYNPGRKAACVTITITNISSDLDLFSHAHLKCYDPTDICRNYLGDSGISGTMGVPISYQIVLPEGTKKFVIILENITSNQVPAAGILTISGLPCQPVLSTRPLLTTTLKPTPGPGNDLTNALTS